MVPFIFPSHRNLCHLLLLFKHPGSRLVFAPLTSLPLIYLSIDSNVYEDPLLGIGHLLDGLAMY